MQSSELQNPGFWVSRKILESAAKSSKIQDFEWAAKSWIRFKMKMEIWGALLVAHHWSLVDVFILHTTVWVIHSSASNISRADEHRVNTRIASTPHRFGSTYTYTYSSQCVCIKQHASLLLLASYNTAQYCWMALLSSICDSPRMLLGVSVVLVGCAVVLWNSSREGKQASNLERELEREVARTTAPTVSERRMLQQRVSMTQQRQYAGSDVVYDWNVRSGHYGRQVGEIVVSRNESCVSLWRRTCCRK